MTSPAHGGPAGATAPGFWEERWHPLREEWVIVAAHRQNRPWSGETVSAKPKALAPYVSDCYLCPGNVRASGKANPKYESTFIFDNDHPCVAVDAPDDLQTPPLPYRSRAAKGVSRVICFSPRHDLTLAEFPVGAVEQVVRVWQKETSDLGRRPEVSQVLCFENKGEVVGVSNPHPHGQIYA
ncbi:MAG TPA: galactose-1-phosphate uridylyltransferase, partial [Polyangiaceae bacterium]